LHLFIDGEVFGGDYYGHRTVLDFTDYLATVEEHYMEEKGGILSVSLVTFRYLHCTPSVAFAYYLDLDDTDPVFAVHSIYKP
jgi:hypothetical protein